MDMRSQSQENTNQKTKISIFHVITAIAFCCLMTQTLTSRLSKEGFLIIEASRDPALLPKERNLDFSMELDEQEPEEQAKQVASGDTEEENQTK